MREMRTAGTGVALGLALAAPVPGRAAGPYITARAAVILDAGTAEEVFAARMTARARELGASTAHFANPHGLTAPGHELSARDLATIFRHGLDLPLFREILETRSVQVPLEANHLQWVALHSHNRL